MKHTEEAKRRIGEASKKRWFEPKYRDNCIKKLKMYYTDSKHIEESCSVAKKRWQSPEYRLKMTGKKRTIVTRKNISEGLKISCANVDYKIKMKEIQESPDYAKKISNTMKELWKDPEFAKKVLHRRTPSGPEQEFICISDRFYLEFNFVGNGELIIDGKNPDFVCINDEHKLIEIWGEHFKLGRNPQDLIDFFKDRGYDCIVIWASELKDVSSVIDRIKKFVEGSDK
jgi:hypothetical protein